MADANSDQQRTDAIASIPAQQYYIADSAQALDPR